eukprot:5050642-Prymnesium_polylepis.1
MWTLESTMSEKLAIGRVRYRDAGPVYFNGESVRESKRQVSGGRGDPIADSKLAAVADPKGCVALLMNAHAAPSAEATSSSASRAMTARLTSRRSASLIGRRYRPTSSMIRSRLELKCTFLHSVRASSDRASSRKRRTQLPSTRVCASDD